MLFTFKSILYYLQMIELVCFTHRQQHKVTFRNSIHNSDAFVLFMFSVLCRVKFFSVIERNELKYMRERYLPYWLSVAFFPIRSHTSSEGIRLKKVETMWINSKLRLTPFKTNCKHIYTRNLINVWKTIINNDMINLSLSHCYIPKWLVRARLYATRENSFQPSLSSNDLLFFILPIQTWWKNRIKKKDKRKAKENNLKNH